jgi:hypothetical protein
MPSEFLIDYTVWVFFSVLGAVQFVAAKSGLAGLLFFRTRRTESLLLAPLAVAASFAWFFGTGFRNLPDTGPGLDANTQALWFALASAAAITVTLALSSALNHRWGADLGWSAASGEAPPEGIGWLERTTFARALAARLAFYRAWRRRRAEARHG